MHNQHLIDTAIIDISCDFPQVIFDRDPAIDYFVKDKLMRVVDEVFDQAARNGTVYRIPRLEIDLGTIPFETYRDEMPKRLRDQLNSILADIRHRHRSGETTEDIVIDRCNAEVEQLYHFLLHGYLPWYSRVSGMVELESLLEQTMNSSPAGFKAFLSRVSHREIVVGRLINQFSVNSIVRVYGMLSPVHCKAVQNYMAELEILIEPNFTRAVPHGQYLDRVMIMIWQYLIMVSLRHNSQQTSSQRLFEQALKEVVVNQLQYDFSELVQFLDRSMQSHPDLKLMAAVLRNFQHDAQAGELKPMISKDLSSSNRVNEGLTAKGKMDWPALNTLRKQLVAALLSGDASVIRTCWSELLTDHVRLFEKTLRYYGQQSTVRRKIAFNFSEDMLLDILMLLEPADYGFLKGVIDSSSLFYAEYSKGSAVQTQHKAEMWEISLAYLLVECDGGFSRQACLYSVIRQRAIAAGQSPSVLLSVLNDNIASLAEADEQSSHFVQYLMVPGNGLVKDIGQLEKHETGLVEHYRGYQCLKASLAGAGPGSRCSEKELLDAVSVLSQQAPWLLKRLYRELQTGVYSDSGIVRHYSVEVIRQLVNAFLSLTAGPHSDIFAAVQRNARTYSNQPNYYLHIFECLLKAELIDFDSIETALSSELEEQTLSEQAAMATNLNDRSEQVAEEYVAFDRAHNLVVDALYGDKDLTENEIDALTHSLDQIVSRQPSVLCQLLESGLADKNFVMRLASNIPEWLQIKLLTLMGVTDIAEMLQYADMLATASLAESIITRPEQLQTQKWTFIYNTMHESGRLFNRDYFVFKYVDSLLEHTNFADTRQLSTVLRDELQRNMLPSTYSATQGLIKALSHDDSDLTLTESAYDAAETAGAHTQDDDLPAAEEEVYIANAGIVLTVPYLPRMFELLGLVKDSAFKDREAAERGVHMLQFLANESVSSPEYQLVLNKLLCGVKPGRPICREIELSAEERKLLESMLSGLIQNWKSLGNTSINGLRESFLQRNGKLLLKNDAWHLSVEARSFDMLLDQIPWSFSTIRLPWMHRVIYVEWR